MSNIIAKDRDPTSHVPCSICDFMKNCQQICMYFEEYINTPSPTQRKRNLKKFEGRTKKKLMPRNSSRKVAQLDKEGVLIAVYDNIHQTTGFTPHSIVRVCNGQLGSHKGYKWRWLG